MTKKVKKEIPKQVQSEPKEVECADCRTKFTIQPEDGYSYLCDYLINNRILCQSCRKKANHV